MADVVLSAADTPDMLLTTAAAVLEPPAVGAPRRFLFINTKPAMNASTRTPPMTPPMTAVLAPPPDPLCAAADDCVAPAAAGCVTSFEASTDDACVAAPDDDVGFAASTVCPACVAIVEPPACC